MFSQKKIKGVSPLIATVLLIAFTMALAAVMTGWLSVFTTGQKEKNAVFEEKIDCGKADFTSDAGFSAYDGDSELFKARILNTGTSDAFVGRYAVWYEGSGAPAVWTISDPQKAAIPKQDEMILIVNVSGGKPVKITFMGYNCEGVTTTATMPLAGWATGAMSASSSNFVAANKTV